jgi:hypothetical protein
MSVETRWTWPSWLAGSRASRAGVGQPLFFHHVAKTGGTSLIRAIRSVTPAALRFSDNGNLPADFVDRLISRGLTPGQFIYGHPEAGAASRLRGRSQIVTLLREPRAHAISAYLHVRTHRTVPDHKLARELDFRSFLLARPYFAVFQTASLHLGIEEQPVERTEDLVDRLPIVLSYLRDVKFLGTIQTASELLHHLGQAMAWPVTPAFPHRRKSRLSSERRAVMEEQYAELQHHSALASLLAAEKQVYEAARLMIASAPWGEQARL